MKVQVRSILQVGLIGKLANKTNGGKNGQKKVEPVDLSTGHAENQATKSSPDNSKDEREVEETLGLSDPLNLGALGITRDTADEDILRVMGIDPSKSTQDVIVSDTKPVKRRVIQGDDKKRANSATAIGFGPEAQLASRWLTSAQVRQLEKDTGMCSVL